MRGTTGRLDDFGARTMGPEPAAGAPTALSARPPATPSVEPRLEAPQLDGGSHDRRATRVDRGVGSGPLSFHDDARHDDELRRQQRPQRHRPTTTGCPRSTETARARSPTRPPRRPPTSSRRSSRSRSSTASTAPTRTRSRTRGAGRTAVNGRRRDRPPHRPRTARLLEDDDLHGLAHDRPSTALTSRCGRGSRRCSARQPASACTRGCRQPGSSAYDGYMLRTNQLAGTDQVVLERIDNGALVNRLTSTRSSRSATSLLLRVKGSVLEIWRHDGARPGRGSASSSDTTYAAAGYTGVGIRGTTGRLDDFGARTMGAPPPDTEPPTAPGTLERDRGQLEPDRPRLGGRHRQRGRRRSTGSSAARARAARASPRSATSTTTSFSNTGLAASTSYTYRVRAQDAVPTWGPYSPRRRRRRRHRPTPSLRARPERRA